MWNFIKGLYFKARNAIAMAFVKTVNFSMRLLNERNDGSFTGFMKRVFSFTVFFAAFIGVKIVIGLVLSVITLVLSYVIGTTLASLVAFVLTVMFVIDLFETISFFRKLNNVFQNAFGKEAIFA